MGAKYDWNRLKIKYVTGDYATLKEFAEKFKINYGVLRKQAVAWQEQKEQCNKIKVTKTIEKTVEKVIEREVDRNSRHIALIDIILDKIELVIKEQLNTNVTPYGKAVKSDNIYVDKLDIAMKVLEKAQKGHRLALGIDKESQGNTIDETNKKIARLADLLNRPVKDRPISDFKEEE
jgi:hypothetical protein